MRAYLSYFKAELIVGLQYKTAALAGLSTQFFWGILYALVYTAFYEYTSVDSIKSVCSKEPERDQLTQVLTPPQTQCKLTYYSGKMSPGRANMTLLGI